MSRAVELLQSLDASVNALRAAMAATAAGWERPPAAGEWSPRLVAEHIVVALGVYSEFLAAAIDREPFDWTSRTYAFPTPEEARERLDELYAWVKEATAAMAEADLSAPVPELGALSPSPTLAGLLTLAGRHLANARQIESAVRA